MKQAEYKASRNEAKRCIARVQAEVMKKQAETLDSKEGRQNIFRIAKQKKKERRDITGTNCLKGDNGELLVSEEQVSDRWRPSQGLKIPTTVLCVFLYISLVTVLQ